MGHYGKTPSPYLQVRISFFYFAHGSYSMDKMSSATRLFLPLPLMRPPVITCITLMASLWMVFLGVLTSGSSLLSSLSFLMNFQSVSSLISLSISSFSYRHSSIICLWSSWNQQYLVLSHLPAFSGLSLKGHLASLSCFLIHIKMCIRDSFNAV